MSNGSYHMASFIAARPNGVLSIAIAASVVVHTALYFAAPRYFAEFTQARTVRYDASLTPAERVMVAATPEPVQQVRRPRPKRFALADALPPAVPAMPEIAATTPDEPPAHIAPPVADTPAPTPVAAAAVTTAAKHRAPVFAERISIEYKLTSAIADGVANFRRPIY